MRGISVLEEEGRDGTFKPRRGITSAGGLRVNTRVPAKRVPTYCRPHSAEAR